jgi:dTDP-4-amino-4,6-dideoxygalactose transaminase
MLISCYRPFFGPSELLAALTPRPARARFEAAAAACFGVRHGVAFSYGRTAIMAALKALDLKDAEIIMPALTCKVVAEGIHASGNRPTFADIAPDGFNMAIEELKRALTPRTRAVMATHLYGYRADIPAIREAIGNDHIAVIEDAAQGLQSHPPMDTRMVGDIAVLSFGRSKHLCAVHGGVAVTDSDDLCMKLRAIRDRDLDRRDPRGEARCLAWFIASYVHYHPQIHGISRKLGKHRHRNPRGYSPSPATTPAPLPSNASTAFSELQARIGLVQFRKLDRVINRRRQLAKYYTEQLKDVAGLVPAPLEEGATYSMYTIRIPQRDESEFQARMWLQGIDTDHSFNYSLPHTPAYRTGDRGPFTVALQAAAQVVNLPCYPGLSDADAARVVSAVRRCVAP